MIITAHTFLRQAPSLVALELIVTACSLYTGIASGLCERQLHGLVEKLETLDFIDCLLRALYAVENDKRLTLGLQVGLCDNVNDFSIFGKELRQGFLELVDLDVLFEVADVNAVAGLAWSTRDSNVRVGVQ